MTTPSDKLYELLPAFYRLRDSDQGEPLRALMSIINDELAALEADMTGLYENWFIETCDDWVVPYIGDLLGVRGLNTIETTSFSQRAYVANTLHYRRRKGTAYVLEQLARDVTGWPAHVVEYSEHLQTTQYMNHVRLFNTSPDLRKANILNLTGSPFDSLPRTADVRHINNGRGKFNIPNIGLYLWRLQNYQMENAIPRKASVGKGYHFSPLGAPMPLFNAPMDAGVPDEQSVPGSIRPLDFYLDIRNFQEKFKLSAKPPLNSRYYGPARSLFIVRDGKPVTPKQILCKNLSDWDQPPAGFVAVDVARGRIAFPAGEEPKEDLRVSYNYGLSADIGGGPYDRRPRIAEAVPGVIEEYKIGETTGDGWFGDLHLALKAWENDGKPPAVIRFYDSRSYDAAVTIDLPRKGWLVIDTENGERPALLDAFAFVVKAPFDNPPIETVTAEDAAALTLSGLLIEGMLVVSGKLNLTINDCTLVPGQALDENGFPKNPDQPSLRVKGDDIIDLSVNVTHSIMGAIEMPTESKSLTIRDSIVDASRKKDADEPLRAAIAADAGAAGPGPVAIIERSTIFGAVFVKILELASEVLFTSKVRAERKQEGCVRFSHVLNGSQTPRRYHCQPDLALAVAAKQAGFEHVTDLAPDVYDEVCWRVRPQFTALRYGNPAYAQLAQACAHEIRTGAENGSEMGAFCMLQQPQREANLRTAVDEYLRFGLEAGIFYAS